MNPNGEDRASAPAPHYADEHVTLYTGDAVATLRRLPDAAANCCVTSPPYFGLRDYGEDGQIGLEASPVDYAEALVDVFTEVRRVLAPDGTLWLNLGDSWSGKANGGATFDRHRGAGHRPGINLRVLCRSCNSTKGATISDAIRLLGRG